MKFGNFKTDMKFEHQNIIFNKKKKIINHHILNHHENNLWFNNRKTFSTINIVEKMDQH